MDIKKRVFIPMILLTIVCGIAVLISSIFLYNRELNNSMSNRIDVAQNIIEFEIEELLSKALLTASAMRVHQNLSEALVSNDNERVTAIANSLRNMAHLDFCTIVDKDGVVVVRVHDPENYGDSLIGLSHVRSALENRVESSIVPGVTIRLGIMAGSPIYDLEENIVGAVSLGFRLDSQAFVERLSQLTECEVAIYLHDELVSSTITNDESAFVPGKIADEKISKRVLAGESFIGRVYFSGRTLLSSYAPLYGANGEAVGMVFIGYDTAESMRNTLLFIILGLLVTLFVLVACIFLARHMSKKIEERMNRAHGTISAMFESNPHINILFDDNFKLIDCNPASLRFLGCETKEELLSSFSQRMAKFLPEYQPDGRRTLPLSERLKMTVRDGANKVSTVIYLGENAKYLDMEFRKIPYGDSFAITAYVQDVTESKEREAELMRILNSISAMIYVTDIETDKILFINDYMKEHFKIGEDVIGQHCYEVLNEGVDKRCDWCPCHQLDIEPDKEVVWEEHNTLTKRHYLNSDRYIDWPDGKKVHIQLCLDVSDAHEREEELERINDMNELHLVKLNTVIKAAKIALWDAEINTDNPLDPNTPVIWSDEFKAMIGYSSVEDFPNVFTSWINCLHPEDAEKTLNAFASHLLDTTGNTPFNTEYRLLKKNGEYAYFLAAGSAIRDENGVAVRVAGALLDISETKNLQFNLENERSTLQLMFDSSPDHIFCKDTNFKYTRCNETLLKYHGLKKEDLIGKDDESGLGVPEEVALELRASDQVVLNENKASVYEENVPDSDGSVRLFETNKVPLILNGKAMGVMGVARDITERKAMEEAAQSANRSKTVFLANMSHEIRTPMNSIIGFSELAQNDDIPDRTRTYLINIQDSAEWLLKIINDILDISKIESGKIEFEHIPFDLPDIFAYCQSAIMPKISEKGIMLYCYAEPSIGKRLLGDPVRLRQIIMNLLSNAVKFTNSGTVKFLASVYDSDESSVTIKFEIKDSGIGMTDKQIERIFNPFTQAEDSITRRFGGTGLGLAITKNIVELMGGALNVESAPGVGSKFSFNLKFDMIDEEDIPHETIMLNDFEKPNFKGEVLVCEDNILNQQVVCDHLERVGLIPTVAHNGKEGVDIITKRIKHNEKPFDLIFMDIHMPVMDGLDAAQKIVALGVKTPIIALTANIMSNDLELYKTSGMNDSVGKPFTSQDLWRCLAKYLPVESYTAIDKRREAAVESKAQKMIKTNFVRNNQTIYDDIVSAIESGDIKLAHRLTHTLKSNSGQMGKKELQSAAAKVEASLASEKAKPAAKEMKALKKELSLVLDDLAPLLNETRVINITDAFDAEKALELLDTLEPMFKNNNTACLKYVDDLYSIPETEKLIADIQGYKFKDALTSLATLRKGLISGSE